MRLVLRYDQQDDEMHGGIVAGFKINSCPGASENGDRFLDPVAVTMGNGHPVPDPRTHLLLPRMQGFHNVLPPLLLNMSHRDEVIHQLPKSLPGRFRGQLRKDTTLRKKRYKFHDWRG